MRIFHNRPLCLACVLFALTSVFSVRMEGTVKLVLLLLLGTFFLALLLFCLIRHKCGRYRFLTVLCMGAVLLSMLSSYLFFDVRYASLQSRNGEELEAQGYVLERIGPGTFYSFFRVRLETVDGEREYVDAILECSFPSSLQVGDAFKVHATAREYTEEEYFDEEVYRVGDGCLLVLTCEASTDYEILPERNHGFLTQVSKLNLKLSYLLRNWIGGEEGGIGAALLLGNRSWISGDTVLAFRRSGTSHLLALSGLHVSILIGFVEWCLRRLRIPKQVRIFLIITVAISYLALTGFAVSTWRAVLMICVLYLAFLWKARYDALTALSLILVLILLFSPYAVLDLSLWMSFLAAGSIIIFIPALQGMLERMRERLALPFLLFLPISLVISAVFVGVVANFGLQLLSAAVFGEISLATVPATLVLSIPVALMLICSALLLVMPSFPYLSELCRAIGNLILRLTSWISSVEDVLLPVGDRLTIGILIALTVSLCLLAVLRIRRRLFILVPILLSLSAVVTSLYVTHTGNPQGPTETVLNVSLGELRLYTEQGDAVLINDVYGSVSESYLIAKTAGVERCTEIEDLVYCHYYNQGTYFLSRLSERIKVRVLHLPIPTTSQEEWIASRLTQEAELHGIRVEYDAANFLEIYGSFS